MQRCEEYIIKYQKQIKRERKEGRKEEKKRRMSKEVVKMKEGSEGGGGRGGGVERYSADVIGETGFYFLPAKHHVILNKLK